MKRKTVILVAFAFGDAANAYHGESNRAIAIAAAQYLKNHVDAMFFAQWEIRDALKALGLAVRLDMVADKKADGTYLDSNDVFQALLYFIGELGNNVEVEIVLCGHPGHVDPRLIMMADKRNLNVVETVTAYLYVEGIREL